MESNIGAETTLWGEPTADSRTITLGTGIILPSMSSADTLSLFSGADDDSMSPCGGFLTLYTNVFGLPARPAALMGAATAVAAGALALGPASLAHASDGS